MSCRDIESLILAERDGALSSAQRTVLSDHVAACPACRELRSNLAAALDAYQADAAAVRVPDADEAWRDLQARLRAPKTQRTRKPLAPVLWFGAPLAAAAALAFAFLTTQTVDTPLDPGLETARADFVEAGDANASTMVYVDKDSGWLVVWAATPDAGKG